jgi:LysR family glycine cleavage system transcriptional activator
MRLPPLNALRAFEATVRCGGFTAAANELGVTPAAVSMQVKKLESWLGKELFFRRNNSVVLTDAGQVLYPRTAASLQDLSQMADRFLDSETRSGLVISTIQFLADRFLAPAASRFRRQHPGTGIEIRIEEDPVDFRRDRIDLRLSYGNQFHPDLPATALLRDSVVPMAAPGLFDDMLPGALKDTDLIHIDWSGGYASYPTWSQWFAQAGLARSPDVRAGMRAAGSAVGIVLAREGAGVVLAPTLLAREETASGRLVPLSDTMVPLAQPYYAIGPNLSRGRPGRQSRRAALTAAFLEELKALL